MHQLMGFKLVLLPSQTHHATVQLTHKHRTTCGGHAIPLRRTRELRFVQDLANLGIDGLAA